MPTFFQRPENALKRANEFIDVDKPQRALDVLYDVIKSKKHRTWQKIHEPIMEKYLALCVDLKKSHVAKEGLYQYKIICQAVNIKSLEDVVRKYLQLAEEKTENAKQESQQAVVNVDDLDVIQTPESLLLSAVSGEDTQDRTDRAILTPWVKFLWESYRQCLDLLRNNSSVERLYQDIAQQAFKFCLNYSRKTEFRKLCDNLRTHLGHIQKHQHQQRAINLNNPDSQAMHLETRLVQLDSAIQMELWQEAFKAIEDIHELIALSKKTKPSLMANYYQKLGLVFWKSGNALFHACAWHRLLHLSREQRKNLSSDELVKLSSRVLCATLSIPIPASKSQIGQLLQMDDNALDKQRRLSTLLGLSSPPTRAGLIKDLVKYSVVQHVYPELRQLYQVLEVEYQPLKLAENIQMPMDFIETKDDLAQYIPALQDITITRLLKQVSQVYERISFARLSALMPFASQFHLERIIVHCAKDLDLQVRIDHQTQSLSFGTDLGVSQKEDIPEGPFLQSMPSEEIRNQLQAMATALHKAMNIIQPGIIKDQRVELRSQIIQTYKQVARKEHARILTRRQIIEERKEELENINIQREREEQEQLEEQKRQAYAAEMARLEREAQEREDQRRKEERNEIRKKAAKERLEQLRSTALGAKVFKEVDAESMVELDPDEILAKQVEQLEKERRELQERLKAQEKKVDFFERAKRLEEIPSLLEQYEKTKVELREFWEHQEAERVETMKAERELALENRDRLKRMQDDRKVFMDQLKEARYSDYKVNLEQFEKMFIEERKKRLQDRKARRKEERRTKWIKEKEEEEQRLRDEELKRKREEEERLAVEKKEKEEAEYHEKIRKLEEIAERQKQREKEIEERLEAQKKEREEREYRGRSRVEDEHDGGDWRREEKRDEPKTWRAAPREGGWREREKAREDTYRPRARDQVQEGDWRGDDRKDERGPPRDEGGSRNERDWRDKPHDTEERRPARDEQPSRDWRDRGPGRDREDKGPPPRSFERERDWRQDNDDRPRDSWRERGMPRDIRAEGWRDRGPPKEERSSWRGRDRDDRYSREDRVPMDRDRDEGPWRRGPPRDRDERGPPRDRDERGPPRDRDEKGPPRDRDDRGPPNDKEERGPPRDREERGPPRDREERGPPSNRDERGLPRDRDERGPPRDRDERGPPRDRDERGPPRDREGGWRRGAPTSQGDRGSWRDREREKDRPDERKDEWRQTEDKRWDKEKDGSFRSREPASSPSKADYGKKPENEEDDGWTMVRR